MFNKVWDISIPLSERTKELEYSQISNYQQAITNLSEIMKELDSILQLSRKELLIIPSARLSNKLLDALVFLTEISTILKRRGKIRVLTNGLDSDFANKFNFINNLNLGDTIEYKESIQLNRFDELVVLCDGKLIIRLNLDNSFNQTAYLSTEGSTIAVQEILYESIGMKLRI